MLWGIIIIIDIKNQNHKLLTTWDLGYSPSVTALSIDFIIAFNHLKIKKYMSIFRINVCSAWFSNYYNLVYSFLEDAKSRVVETEKAICVLQINLIFILSLYCHLKTQLPKQPK